ncbi:MAG: PaaI family thioesterase [Proteobacteria bacterium]|nr:PaaI family thioesterase [Pseudomonadota bacterium]
MSVHAVPVVLEEDFTAVANANLGGWNRAMGLRFIRVTVDECVAEVVIGEQHRQPYGIVHGGVHAGLIEAACSAGAGIVARARGQSVAGLENSTSFIAAAREGTIRVTAVPVTRGRRTQVWEARVTDAAGKTLATGRVRVICLERGAELAGRRVD